MQQFSDTGGLCISYASLCTATILFCVHLCSSSGYYEDTLLATSSPTRPGCLGKTTTDSNIYSHTISLSLTHTHTISFSQLHASTTSTHSSGGTSCQSYTTLDLCEANTCGSKKHCYWNYTTESCSCCSQLCSYPLKLNKILCQCFCSENNYCSGNRRMKYQTCECLCIHQECTDGKKFDGESCQCVCPDNSYWDNSVMHCIADCETVSADDCEIVKSAKNTHAYCIRDGGSCRRPSCTTFYRDQMLCSISTCEETGELCR